MTLTHPNTAAKSRTVGLRTRRFGASLGRFYILAAAGCAIVSCGGGEEGSYADDVVAVFDGIILTEPEVAARVPRGLEPGDSVVARNAVIEGWVTDRLFEQVASENLTDDERARIDRLVDDYRRHLLADAYQRRVEARADLTAVPDSVRAWYDSHPEEMLLTRPLVKGLCLRLPRDSRHLDEARVWVADCSAESVDRIETQLMGEASKYEYFADRWIGWDDLTERVPGLPVDPLPDRADYEAAEGRSVYLVHVCDRLSPGDTIPWEYAAPRIAERLKRRGLDGLTRDLRVSAARRMVESGRLRLSAEALRAMPYLKENKNDKKHKK